jgi:hypothetical protein
MATIKLSAQRAVAHHAQLKLSAPGADVSDPAKLGDLGSAERSFVGLVRIPASRRSGKIAVTASVAADHAVTRSASSTITVTPGASTGGLGGLPGGLGLTANGKVPPLSELGSLGQPNLPLIGEQPAVAPASLGGATPISLRANTAPFGFDPMLYRLVWIQVAWLSALLVGLSMLLTQLRLNRRRVPTSAGRTARLAGGRSAARSGRVARFQATPSAAAPATEGRATKAKAAKGKTVKQRTAKAQPATDQATKSQSAKGQATKKPSAKGSAAKGRSVKSQSASGKPAKGKPSKDQAAKGKPAKGKPSKDQAAKGKPAKGKPAKGQGSTGGTGRGVPKR